MYIKNVKVENYRLLKDISFNFHKRTTLIVGRNNTGKTSLTEIFRCFFDDKRSMSYYDFNQGVIPKFFEALKLKEEGKKDNEIREAMPIIKLELLIDYEDNKDEYGSLSDFIIDLDDACFETKVVLSFRLQDGKINNFFDGLVSTDEKGFYKELKNRINGYFETALFAVDPSNDGNQLKMKSLQKIKQALLAKFINAQRNLDDETYNEKDLLGKSLGNIFDSSSSKYAPDDFKQKAIEIEEVVKQLQTKVDTDFKGKVEKLLPALKIFGYPNLKDPNLTASTELDVKSLLGKSTKVHYQKNKYFTLPETYNGLGVRNLVLILFNLHSFFREFQSQEHNVKGQVIFIEEPEAHLHPQMQEVFIRQLDEIVKQFETEFNDGNKWAVQFVVTTHSTHIANETDFSQVRYFLSENSVSTKVKDLSLEFNESTNKEDKEFIHKYLTLTKCDLYFADLAVFIEGATERILLPEIIKKLDTNHSTTLRSKYLSIVEIGGAYAHHFYKFIDFLELKTLVITDLDSTKAITKPDKNGANRTNKYACPVFEGTHSSNSGLKKWFSLEADEIELPSIRSKTTEKIMNNRSISFQVAEDEKTACGRSFEDAFILANRDLYKDLDDVEDENEAEQIAYDIADTIGKSSKANFAIEYAIDKTTWEIPKYIKDGLIWLAKDLEGGTDAK